MVEIYFVHSLSLAMGPGDVIECAAGEVMSFPEEIATRLLKGPFALVAGPDHKDARRRTHDERRVSDKGLANLIAPEFSEDAYIASAEKAMRAAAAKAYLSEQRALSAK